MFSLNLEIIFSAEVGAKITPSRLIFSGLISLRNGLENSKCYFKK